MKSEKHRFHRALKLCCAVLLISTLIPDAPQQPASLLQAALMGVRVEHLFPVSVSLGLDGFENVCLKYIICFIYSNFTEFSFPPDLSNRPQSDTLIRGTSENGEKTNNRC
jgi:hypothetical protein